jgi:hypothetical protein
LKGKKTFDFGFVAGNRPLSNREIMEEEKTTEPLESTSGPTSHTAPTLSNPPKKKDKKSFLSINTEAINEMYTFGGEKGQQIIISEDEEQMELERIMKLAKKCVDAMKGNISEESEEVQEQKRPNYAQPPMTTTNKAVAKKKSFNRIFFLNIVRLIS